MKSSSYECRSVRCARLLRLSFVILTLLAARPAMAAGAKSQGFEIPTFGFPTLVKPTATATPTHKTFLTPIPSIGLPTFSIATSTPTPTHKFILTPFPTIGLPTFSIATSTPTPTHKIILTPFPTIGLPTFSIATATPTLAPTAADTPTLEATATQTQEPTATATFAETQAATASPTATLVPPSECYGDCNADGHVDISELVRMVGMALETDGVSCATIAADEKVSVADLIRAVANSLNGCAPAV